MKKQKTVQKNVKSEGLANFILVRKFRETFDHMLSNRLYIILPGIFDLLLFFIYGLITGPIWGKVLEQIQAIAYVAQNQPSAISQNIPTEGIIGAFAGDVTAYYLRNFLLLLLIIAIFTYFLYSFFQAIAWYIAKRQSKESKSLMFYKYLEQFFRINILWFVLFLVYYSARVIYGYIAQRTLRFNPSANVSIVIWLLILFLAVISYFAFISYGLMGNYRVRDVFKKGFKLGIIRIYIIFPMFLIILGIFITINYILKYASLINEWLAVILGFALTVPALAFTRLFLIKVVEELDKIFE